MTWLVAMAGRFLIPIFQWFGLHILLPWLQTQGKVLLERFKNKAQYKKKVEENTQGNTNYEANPTDDTFGSSP